MIRLNVAVRNFKTPDECKQNEILNFHGASMNEQFSHNAISFNYPGGKPMSRIRLWLNRGEITYYLFISTIPVGRMSLVTMRRIKILGVECFHTVGISGLRELIGIFNDNFLGQSPTQDKSFAIGGYNHLTLGLASDDFDNISGTKSHG